MLRPTASGLAGGAGGAGGAPGGAGDAGGSGGDGGFVGGGGTAGGFGVHLYDGTHVPQPSALTSRKLQTSPGLHGSRSHACNLWQFIIQPQPPIESLHLLENPEHPPHSTSAW